MKRKIAIKTNLLKKITLGIFISLLVGCSVDSSITAVNLPSEPVDPVVTTIPDAEFASAERIVTDNGFVFVGSVNEVAESTESLSGQYSFEGAVSFSQ